MNSKGNSVAIIGSGAAGTILAYQIVDKVCNNSGEGITVYLIEKEDVFGPGLAYSTPLLSHILNVRSNTLGVNSPLGFSEWLEGQNKLCLDTTNQKMFDSNYLPREIYGRYLKHILDLTIKKAASGQCSIELIKGKVVDLDRDGNIINVKLDNGRVITSKNAVLAPGNFPGSFLHELKGVKGYIHYPWPVSLLTKTISKDDPVCILGTGLSAIDTLFTLLENNHRGKITFISRRGFLPKVQGSPAEYRLKYLSMESINRAVSERGDKSLPLEMVKELFFKEMEAAEEKNIDWLSVFNPAGSITQILEKDISRAESGVIPYQAALTASGPVTGLIWNSMSIEDRMRFDREYKTLWTVYRHPMPLINAKKILSALKSGQLDIESGCMCVRTCGGTGFEIDVSTRFGVPYTIKTPIIINATGQGLDVTTFNDTLLDRLIEKGLIEPHPNGGIHVDFNTSEVRGCNSDSVSGLFALGEITRGVHFFTNGIVPNMVISKRIADSILSNNNALPVGARGIVP